MVLSDVVGVLQNYELHLQIFDVLNDFSIRLAEISRILLRLALINIENHTLDIILTLLTVESVIRLRQIRTEYVKVVVIRYPQVIEILAVLVSPKVLQLTALG